MDELKLAADWFNEFLTEDELKSLCDRTGNDYMNVYHDSFDSALFSRFKYLYDPITEEEFIKWKEISKRVDNDIINNTNTKLVNFIESLTNRELIELKNLLK